LINVSLSFSLKESMIHTKPRQKIINESQSIISQVIKTVVAAHIRTKKAFYVIFRVFNHFNSIN